MTFKMSRVNIVMVLEQWQVLRIGGLLLEFLAEKSQHEHEQCQGYVLA